MACARCRRPVKEPEIVNGRGYGKRCAELVMFGDLFEPQPRTQITSRKRKQRGDSRQTPLFAEAQPC